MGARGDLRHHAAIGRVVVDLRMHDIGQDRPLPSGWRSITAAAVSSQVVSIPSTSIGWSVVTSRSLLIAEIRAFPVPGVALRGRKVQSSCVQACETPSKTRTSDMAILVTRPQPDNARTAAALRARGHDVLAAPMLRFEKVMLSHRSGRAISAR